MISPALVGRSRCPDCRGGLVLSNDSSVRCTSCGRVFDAARGFLDLRPSKAFTEQTKYLDEALHADARHETVAPPLLGSRVRSRMLRRFLRPEPHDRVLDLGCGSGRTLIWNSDAGAQLTGVDISPFFAREAIERCELVLGDLRRLPIQNGVFTKAWSLDVFEHLSPQALRDVLLEAQRVLAPGGALFVYTHVRKNGGIAAGVRLVNRLAAALERIGLLDLRQERLRKSDHLNPLADHDELRKVVNECGFTIERITYYTPVLGAFIENVLIRIAERFLQRRAGRRSGHGSNAVGDEAARMARTQAKARIRQGGATYFALRVLSAVMMLDVWLFGRIRSGPFFALLRKNGLRPQASGLSRATQAPEAGGPRPEA